jgi:demethylmenaquinone methyltransferase/2-methoxy-6-polyprenyl-1,4-benzoquinol methylase
MLKQAGKGTDKVLCDNQDATELSHGNDAFDLGIISLALHEKPYDIAKKIIEEAFRIIKPGGYLIVVDYVFDERTNKIFRIPVHIAERLAGKEHYRHFRQYIGFGGMDRLMNHREFEKEFRFHRGATMLRLYRITKDQYA